MEERLQELEIQNARLQGLEVQNARLQELEVQNARLQELEVQNAARLQELEVQNSRLLTRLINANRVLNENGLQAFWTNKKFFLSLFEVATGTIV